MSNSGLIFYIGKTQAPHGLNDQIVEFVRVRAAADPRQAFAAIHGAPLRVFLQEGVVAGLLQAVRNFVNRLLPCNVFPMIRARPPYLWLQKPPRIEDVTPEMVAPYFANLGADELTFNKPDKNRNS